MRKIFHIADGPSRAFTTGFLLLILVGVFVTAPRAGGGTQRVRFPERVQAAYDRREREINSELKRYSRHDWAGVYDFGSGVGIRGTIRIAPTSGFVANEGGCTGIYAINYGTVTIQSEMITLRSERTPDKEESAESVITMVLVRWGARRYLIPDDEVIDFCNEVNAGWEPERRYGGRFLMRRGSEEKPVSGKPEIPAPYHAYLLSSPLEATIISVHSSRVEIDNDDPNGKARISRFTLNAGHAEGVRSGMEFHAYEPNASGSARIVQVSAHAAEAVIIDIGAYAGIPAVGWKLSTRIKW